MMRDNPGRFAGEEEGSKYFSHGSATNGDGDADAGIGVPSCSSIMEPKLWGLRLGLELARARASRRPAVSSRRVAQKILVSCTNAS